MLSQLNLNIKNKSETKPCDYCVGSDFKVLSRKDRYGLPVTTVICKACGLIFLSPVMNAQAYADFYEHSYRELLRLYKNKKEDQVWNLGLNFKAAVRLGSSLAAELKNYVRPGLMIEVGSSTGGILSGFKQLLPNLEVLGVEPSSREAGFATQQNIDTRVGLIENMTASLPLADNILIVRSLNHLLSPKYFLNWAHQQLKDDGRLIVMVINFLGLCESKSSVYSQIDHPFMFSPEALINFVEAAGFDIIFSDSKNNPKYIKLVAVKKDRIPFDDLKISPEVCRLSLKKLNPIRLSWSKVIRRFN